MFAITLAKLIMLYQKLTIREINVLWHDILFYLLRNSTEAYSEPSLKHCNKAFLLKKLTALPEYIFYEVAGLTQPEFTCSKSTMQTSEHCVKSVQS